MVWYVLMVCDVVVCDGVWHVLMVCVDATRDQNHLKRKNSWAML
jgi:hypothetical protein